MSPTTDPPAPSPPPPLPRHRPLPVLRDFADWLSPMMVKELRQGMRTWVFVGAFIALQVLLVLSLLISSGAGNDEKSGYFFWWMAAIILVGILPLRGFGALAEEMKMQTLDLLVLTRLGAWRITFGKWTALISQSSLLAISILPYVVMRYFSGGINVFREIWGLLMLWLLSALLTAFLVCFSSLRSFILRGALLLGVIWMAGMAAFMVIVSIVEPDHFGTRLFRGSSDGAELFWTTCIIVAIWAWFCYFFLDMGAGSIAPAAANHSTRKRLLAGGIVALCALGIIFINSSDWTVFLLPLMTATTGLACIDALSETPTFSPGVFRPFVRFGWPGRVAAAFLTPGWHTGILFTVVMMAIWSAEMAHWQRESGASDDTRLNRWLAFLNAPGVLFCPLAFTVYFLKRTEKLLAPILIICLIAGLYGGLISIMVEITDRKAAASLGVLTPLSALIASSTVGGSLHDPGPSRAVILFAATFMTLLWTILAFLKAIPLFRRAHEAGTAAAKGD